MDEGRRTACQDAGEVYHLAADMGGMGCIEPNKALCMLWVLINTPTAEAIDTAGAGTAAGDASWRNVLEAALAEYEARQAASDSATPAANRDWADLSLPALVALARRRVGRSWTEQERRQYAFDEREEPP